MEKEAKKSRPITEEVCRQLQLMMAGGADGVEAARLVGISQSRASRIKKAGFDLATYRENDRREREEQEKRKKEPQAEEHAEEQVPGQIAMDLTPAEKPEMCDQTKMMRFQAMEADKILKTIKETTEAVKNVTTEIITSTVMLNTKLDRLNDTMSMILRAVRKE